MNKQREALKVGVNALLFAWEHEAPRFEQNAIAIIRKALAEPEQEPAAWRVEGSLYASREVAERMGGNIYTIEPLYTAPPTRKSLTYDELCEIALKMQAANNFDGIDFARAIERAHGIQE